MGFRETSAKTGNSVERTFTEFASALHQRWKERKDIDTRTPPKPSEVRTVVVKKQEPAGGKKKCKC